MTNPKLNGPIITIYQAIKHVVASSPEAETRVILLNGKSVIPIWYNQIVMSHPQTGNSNPLKSNRKIGFDITRYLMNPKRYKSLDMQYQWLEDPTNMFNLNTYWERGIYHREDYLNKHHPQAYHKIMRYKYLQKLHLITNHILSTHLLHFNPQNSQ